MVWNTNCPDGSKSVKTNESIIQDNVTYTETTMNVDHYWNIGGDEDGHHQFVQMPNSASDITLASGMNGGTYLKETTEGRAQGFYRNSNGIYQYIPAFKEGSHNVTNSFTNVTTVPANSYGHVYFFGTAGNNGQNGQMGFFKSGSTTCQAYTTLTYFGNSTTANTNFIFGNNDQVSGLNLRVKAASGTSTGSYDYRIVYWEM